MSKISSSELVLVVLFGLICTYAFPSTYTIGTMVVATVAFILTKSLMVVVGVFIGAIIIRVLNAVLTPKPVRMTPQKREPVGYDVEGFQPKNPISIHQRITSQKGDAPLVPKMPVITGVLESPQILGALQLSEVMPPEQGGSPSTLPSPVRGPEAIRTPPEAIPMNSGEVHHPVPLLQNGPDSMAVVAALATKGTSLFGGQPSTELPGAAVGPAAA